MNSRPAVTPAARDELEAIADRYLAGEITRKQAEAAAARVALRGSK